MLEEYRVKDIDALEPGTWVGINFFDLWQEKSGIPLPPLIISEGYDLDDVEHPAGMSDDVWIDDKLFMRAYYDLSMYVGAGWSFKIDLLGIRPDDGEEVEFCTIEQDCGLCGACWIESVNKDKVTFFGETWDGKTWNKGNWWSLSRENAEKFLCLPADKVDDLYFEISDIETSQYEQ